MPAEQNPFRSPSSLYPDLAARIEQAKTAQANVQSRMGQDLAHVGLAELVKTNVERGESLPAVEVAHARMSKVLERIDVNVPDLETFEDAGIDFAYLEETYDKMQVLNLEPEYIFAPVLPFREWSRLCETFENDPDINHDGRIVGGGLAYSMTVEHHWQKICSTDRDVTVDEMNWQVLVVPATNKPPVVDVSHTGTDASGVTKPELQDLARRIGVTDAEFTVSSCPHLTVGAYTMLQAARMVEKRPMIDEGSWTILHGEVHGEFVGHSGPGYPIGTLYDDDGMGDDEYVREIGLFWEEQAKSHGSQGIRPVAWGKRL